VFEVGEEEAGCGGDEVGGRRGGGGCSGDGPFHAEVGT